MIKYSLVMKICQEGAIKDGPRLAVNFIKFVNIFDFYKVSKTS